MKFSIFLMGDATGTYHDMVEEVALAEDLGFCGAWLGERHLANGDLLWPSPMVAASYMAARTRRIRIGLAARILPFHHPLLVAADALTLDVLSRGRCDLGLSRGSMDEASHAAFGVSRDEARLRFDEQYEVLRLACRGEPFSFKGRHFDLKDLVPNPRPVQRPHPPFFIVPNTPTSLDDAAERGLPVFANGALDLAGVARTVDRYRSRGAEAGQATSAAGVILNRFVFVGRTNEEAHRTMREPFMRFLETRAPDLRAYLVKTFGDLSYDFLAREICIFGDADHCASRFAELHQKTGIEHFLCTFNLITLDHRQCLDSLRRFGSDVMKRDFSPAPRIAPAAPAYPQPQPLSQPETITP
jgi:alkanesulfonate monooxygenase SsuD/methylene tetrahydromethanopterin reductase-like flavin-dependent oxidoreductase (luciferase family)